MLIIVSMPIDTQYFVDMSMICRDILVPANIYIYIYIYISRGGNRAGRAGPKPGRAKIGPIFSGQNFNSSTRPKNRVGRAK